MLASPLRVLCAGADDEGLILVCDGAVCEHCKRDLELLDQIGADAREQWTCHCRCIGHRLAAGGMSLRHPTCEDREDPCTPAMRQRDAAAGTTDAQTVAVTKNSKKSS